MCLQMKSSHSNKCWHFYVPEFVAVAPCIASQVPRHPEVERQPLSASGHRPCPWSFRPGWPSVEWQISLWHVEEFAPRSFPCRWDGRRWPAVNFINILRAAFTPLAPKSVRIQSSCQYLFTLLGPTGAKAARRTMMKLTPAVNFINILRAAFAPILFCQKIKSQSIIREKLHKTREMVMKLTSVVNFPIISQSTFVPIFFQGKSAKENT